MDKVGPNGYTDCPRRKFLCNDPVYYQYMSYQCPKSCSRCWFANRSNVMEQYGRC
ncbi:unnamed protein product [Enterobius vermicularis]|uniref:ShKT domain-containing protein n=1 Tax=Enterobius vermicularis TaxID=51028 RepID=A0A0N4V7K8_ENTVE|nr:unnamed protein product [Enterobius vermicularis]